ncbi:hypothetical protein V8E36_006309 [Tilletia maclaganii]
MHSILLSRALLAIACAIASLSSNTLAAPTTPGGDNLSPGLISLGADNDPGFASTADARRRIAAPRFDAAESVNALKAKYNKFLRSRAPGLSSSGHLPADAPPLLHRKKRQLIAALEAAERDDEEDPEKRLLTLLNGLLNAVFGALSTILFDGKFGIAVASTSNEEADNEWLTTLGVGTPPQNLQVVLDTGSPDTWVYSPSCCYQNDRNYFKPSRSLTYSNRTVVAGQAVRARPGKPGQKWSVTYGNGYSTANGYVGIDNLTLGDSNNLRNPPLQAAELPIALITSMTGSSRAGRAMEGLVGLTPSITSDTDGGWTSPMERLISTGKLAQPYLSATLGRADRATGKNGGGRYLFGAVDNSAIRDGESVAWVNTTSTYYWGTNYDSMRMGSTNIVPPNTVQRIIIDTGSALLNLPSAITQNANNLIKGSYYDGNSGVWLVPCKVGDADYEASLADADKTLSYWLGIAGSSFGVSPLDMVFSPNTPLVPANATSSTDYCYSAFQVGPNAVSIVGGSFLKNHMVTFDFGPPPFTARRIGFANRTDAPI